MRSKSGEGVAGSFPGRESVVSRDFGFLDFFFFFFFWLVNAEDSEGKRSRVGESSVEELLEAEEVMTSGMHCMGSACPTIDL